MRVCVSYVSDIYFSDYFSDMQHPAFTSRGATLNQRYLRHQPDTDSDSVADSAVSAAAAAATTTTTTAAAAVTASQLNQIPPQLVHSAELPPQQVSASLRRKLQLAGIYILYLYLYIFAFILCVLSFPFLSHVVLLFIVIHNQLDTEFVSVCFFFICSHF